MREQDKEDYINTSGPTQPFKGSTDLPKILHALANKLLPIVAFSDLGVRNAKDPMSLNYFEKIRHAAGDARELIVSVRRELQEEEQKKGEVPIDPGLRLEE